MNRGLVLPFSLAIAVQIGAFGQLPIDTSREASQLDDMVNTGKYVEAAKFAKSRLDRLHVLQRDDEAPVFLTYLGKVALEVGQPSRAAAMFDAADRILSQAKNTYYEPALMREKAALSYAAGKYTEASELAGRAYRASREHGYYSIRAEYCQSLQALALLRSGNVGQAERLVLGSAKTAAASTSNKPIFAPRILYAACVVTAHAGKLADAESFCRRGSEIVSQAKSENRDLSVGYLAWAEYYLMAGDLPRSRDAALSTLSFTKRAFGPQHQDAIDALAILAEIQWKLGDVKEARTRVHEAVGMAEALFGGSSPAADLPGHPFLSTLQRDR